MSRPKAMTVPALRKMKRDGQKLTMLTAYDSTFARLLDRAGVDIILVGDSLGMVVQGKANTLAVTVDHMAYHGAAVSGVVERSHVVVDMPFLSYHVSDEEAVRNAGRLVQEGGAHSVKLEGGRERASTIEALVRAQIPVMGHIGLTPQSFHVQGGFKVQGKTDSAGQRLLEDALAVEAAGAWSIVLEGIPASLAAEISEVLTIPTIGIGAGNGCDGQVLVIYDVLGMEEDFKPKFVRRYASLGGVVTEAVQNYVADVRSGAFPDDAHSFHKRTGRTNGSPRGAAPVSDIGSAQEACSDKTISPGGYGPSESESLPA